MTKNVEAKYRVEDFVDVDWSEKQYDNVVGICFLIDP